MKRKKSQSEMENILKQFKPEKKELIHILHKVQSEQGFISPSAIFEISKYLRISEGEVYGVLTFYNAFTLEPKGKHTLTICMGTACHVRGAPAVLDEFSRQLDITAGQTTEDKYFTLETVNCVGACALGPIAITDGHYHGHVTTKEVKKIIDEVKEEKGKNRK
ncbi:MAG: NAD(P)H-dependent oxidoreductase subunit E [Candidatus Aminicenantes bacterium]|nr:NAD(P)H-dependent oxidoreductase subunit E [Candidatus Aminicenantes bacterium]